MRGGEWSMAPQGLVETRRRGLVEAVEEANERMQAAPGGRGEKVVHPTLYAERGLRPHGRLFRNAGAGRLGVGDTVLGKDLARAQEYVQRNFRRAGGHQREAIDGHAD